MWHIISSSSFSKTLNLLLLLKWPSQIPKKSPSFTKESSTTPPNILTNTQEDSISSITWKNKERISLNTSSKDFSIKGVFIPSKPKKYWDPSQSFQQANHPRMPKNMTGSLTRSSISLNHYGSAKSHCQSLFSVLWWLHAPHKALSSAHCSSHSPRSSAVGLAIQWLTTDIDFSWSTVELSRPWPVDIVWNGGAQNTTCITFSQIAHFTMKTSSTTTKSTFTNSFTWNGDSIPWLKLSRNFTTYLF